MPSELKKFNKGGPRTLIEAVEANKLVEAINGLLRMKISPGDMGKVVQGDDGTTIDLSPLIEYIKQAVQQAVAGNGTNPNNDGTSSGNGGGSSSGNGGSGGSGGGGPGGNTNGYPATAQFVNIIICDAGVEKTVRVLTV